MMARIAPLVYRRWPAGHAAVVAVVIALLPVPGAAQCLLCSGGGSTGGTGNTGDSGGDPGSIGAITMPGNTDERPLRVDVTANLDFARLVAGTGGGSIAIDPGSGRAATSGNVATLGGLSFSGRVRVEGTPGRTIRIDMPRDITLTSPTGGVAHVTGITTGLPPVVRIGADGRLEFGFGGRLELTGAADGDYRGRIMVTVSYD